MSAITIQGSSQSNILIADNVFRNARPAVRVNNNVINLTISGNSVIGDLLWIDDAEVSGAVVGNTAQFGGLTATVWINYDGPTDLVIADNLIHSCQQTGILLDAVASGGPERVTIEGNSVVFPGGDDTNTYDGIAVLDGVDVFVYGNKIVPRESGPDTRYGVNLGAGSVCCKVVGNDLGDPADYGTDALNPGTGNQLVYPDDATYGDNFTGCDTSPSSP